MNEVQLIRRQIALERQHLRELAPLCAGTPRGEEAAQSTRSNVLYDGILITYEVYLSKFMNRERGRCTEHLARLSARRSLSPAQCVALERLQAALSTTSVADASLARRAALACDLIESVEIIEALVEPSYTVDEWRKVAHVDADSVLEERRLWAEVGRRGTDTAAR